MALIYSVAEASKSSIDCLSLLSSYYLHELAIFFIQVKEYIGRAEELKLQLKPQKHEGALVDGVIQRSESTDNRTELCKYNYYTLIHRFTYCTMDKNI